MRSFAVYRPCLAFILIGLCHSFCAAFSEDAKRGKEAEQRILAILDPIDLHTQRPDHEWGEFLRKSFSANAKWKVLTRDTVILKLKDYRIDPGVACHEFQCAFDGGNILSAEFILFGSVTSQEELYAYTLNLVHVPTSQTVWSRVGEVRKKQIGLPYASLEAAFTQIASGLGPDQVRTGRRDKRGLLTVLDLSAAGSTPSRIMAERVATHLYASRNYDIMGRKEMEELLKALDISKGSLIPTDTALFSLGGKMDVTHLVYSRLTSTRDGKMQLQLALYDIASKRKVREWPSQPTDDFKKLLEFEDRFFTNLFRSPEYDAGAPGMRSSSGWTWAGAGLGLAAGAAFGYLAYMANRDADREYDRFLEARSREAAESRQSKVLDKERSSVVYGILGGLSLAGAGGFLVISF
jgi:hypothetical protein